MTIRHYLPIAVIAGWTSVLLAFSSAGAYQILPPHYGLTVKFIGTAAETYSNNIRFAENNKDKIEDFVTGLSLGLDLRFEGKKRNMGLTGIINRQMRNGSLDNVSSSENLSANFSTAFSEYDSISFNNSFSHTQVPETFAVAFGRLRGRLNQYNNSTTLKYNREISKDLKIGTNYRYSVNRSAEEGTTDSIRNSLGLTANYAYSAITGLSLSYSYSNSRSEDEDRLYIQTILVNITRQITRHLSINGGYGVNIFSTGGIRTTRQSINFSLANEIFVDKKSTASLNYSRGIDIAPDREDLFDNWKITANINRDFLEELAGTMSFFYGKGKFISTGFKDTLFGFAASLDYRVWEGKKGQSIKGTLGYDYFGLDSTEENRGFTRSAINIGIRAGL